MRTSPRSWTALLTHATGAMLTAAFAGALVVYGVVAPPTATSELGALADALAAARQTAADLHRALQTQQRRQGDHAAQLAAIGPMPAPLPAETLLAAIGQLALDTRLSVVRQLPLPSRTYPGLLEQRFAYEVTGATQDLIRFFHAVETSPSWTDIGYLKVDDARTAQDKGARKATLTFSAFSMAPAAAPAPPRATTGG